MSCAHHTTFFVVYVKLQLVLASYRHFHIENTDICNEATDVKTGVLVRSTSKQLLRYTFITAVNFVGILAVITAFCTEESTPVLR
jgi:hypothetical protein